MTLINLAESAMNYYFNNIKNIQNGKLINNHNVFISNSLEYMNNPIIDLIDKKAKLNQAILTITSIRQKEELFSLVSYILQEKQLANKAITRRLTNEDKKFLAKALLILQKHSDRLKEIKRKNRKNSDKWI
ncbi:hypothetical protein VF14_23390 [Nostoc linckia z18]|uniref:Uncharacterized protein n=2 Tax=Nostoc linckia TaxID=92942 RepID=A0A9Q6EIP9_NOSLI|nr:hypothetical protein [Nostoc linckia]PHJ90864.1 hypothetical protein VF04_30480 [Nostoc linckia z7]PHK31751.1 hypothetical protein VF14_23390 [Nostoc linckia z18]PHK38428.1 hypothetical protein VF12_18140 [Nostoc linckia z15]PHK43417.1 hypothetical protein VF13_27320 [Nostoc linckia z16]PHJ67003.1 hypothetical protein VF02_06765 [Nostoc linckia z1]